MRLEQIAATAALIFLAGCTNGPNVTKNDPLLGGPPIGSAPSKATGSVAASPRTSSDPLKLPTPTGATSPAALAAGPPADGGLRIGGPTEGGKPPPALTNNPTDAAPWHGAGATLKRPEPLKDPNFQPAAGVGPPTAGDGSRYLQDELTRAGVQFQELRMEELDVWRFSCGVASPQNPSLTRRYEAVAPGEEGQAAIRAVLDRIHRDRADAAIR
jgi:hypothetical protein